MRRCSAAWSKSSSTSSSVSICSLEFIIVTMVLTYSAIATGSVGCSLADSGVARSGSASGLAFELRAGFFAVWAALARGCLAGGASASRVRRRMTSGFEEPSPHPARRAAAEVEVAQKHDRDCDRAPVRSGCPRRGVEQPHRPGRCPRGKALALPLGEDGGSSPAPTIKVDRERRGDARDPPQP